MKKQFLLFIIFSSLANFLFSQGWQPMGSRSMSLANATVAIEDVWAFHHNPAALASLKKIGAGVSYENRFLLKELQSQGFVVAVPLKKGVISFGGQTFGYNQFRTYRTGLGYSMALAEFISVGVQLNYNAVRINPSYGNHQTVTAEVGILAKVSNNWSLAFSTFNITRNKLSDFAEDRYSTVLRFGTRYSISDKVFFLAEAEKNVDYNLRFKTGFEYVPISNFFVRGGFATAPIEYTFGLGYAFSGVYKLDLGSAYHQFLGWSPHFSFTYQLK
ncbi:MAG: hypothetical protein EBU01_04715 [Crocinitomicaceae bacterium]|nr:hypothetical protein [Crocinitomicaceae bacterium]